MIIPISCWNDGTNFSNKDNVFYLLNIDVFSNLYHSILDSLYDYFF